MDRNEDKQNQIERYRQGTRRAQTLAERKALQQLSKERRSQRTSKGREREDTDEAIDGVERMRTRGGTHRHATQERSTSSSDDVDGVHGLVEALVVGLAPGRAAIRFASSSEPSEATLTQDIAHTQRSSIAVGDRALVRELAPGRWRIERVASRTSQLARPDAARPGVDHLVAANVDLAVVVVAASQPAFRPRVADRYLVALEHGGIAPFVAVNKSDLVDGAERERIEVVLAELARAGVSGALVSTLTRAGLDELAQRVVGRTVVLVGQSGVGKSSLANALFPTVAARIGRVRDGDGKGRHTTTSSYLFEVDDVGTRVIDTPGVRSFGLSDVSRAELAAYFTDFEEHRAGCRFADCTHTHEPTCGVRAAAEDGRLPARRYDAYLRIFESL